MAESRKRRKEDSSDSVTGDHEPSSDRIVELNAENEAFRKEIEQYKHRDAERRRIEESLKESQEKFRSLIQDTPDGIILNDDNGVILEWNAGMEETTGIQRADAIGRTILEIASQCIPENNNPENANTWLSSILDELNNKTPCSSRDSFVEVSIKRPDGSIRIIEAKNFDFSLQGRHIYGGIIRDITERRRTEESLIESKEELRNLIESLGDGIIITDEEGRIIEMNKAEERITGLVAEEVLGQPVWEIQASRSDAEWHEPDPRLWYRNVWDHILHDETDPFYDRVYTDQLKTEDGEIRYLQVKAFRVSTRKGFRVGAIVRDITEQKQIEMAIQESEEKYRTLVETSPDVIVIHQGGKIVYVNPAVVKLLRTAKKPEDLIGMDIYDLIHPDFHSIVREVTQDDLNSLPPATEEVQVVRGDGTIVTLEGIGTRILFNGIPAVQVVIRDITDRKSAELRLKEYTGNLKRSNEDLELFAYIATHDLQEPIRGIVAYSQLLLAECKAEHSAQTKKYLENIARDGLRLNDLVSDLREYLRVRSDGKPFAPTDMETVLANILNTLHREVKETRASITHDPLPVIYADSSQMTQVLQNLLSNAMKFQQKGVVPAIHVSATPTEGMWQFAVQDNGIGIPEEYFEKIFILFERLYPRNTYPGTGLGLALCKRIVERHGGRMWVESEQGKGSTFYFTIPEKSPESMI